MSQLGGPAQYFRANPVYELKKLPLEFAQFQKERENTNGRFQTFKTSTGATKCSLESSKLPEWLHSNKLLNIGTQFESVSVFLRWPILFLGRTRTVCLIQISIFLPNLSKICSTHHPQQSHPPPTALKLRISPQQPSGATPPLGARETLMRVHNQVRKVDEKL